MSKDLTVKQNVFVRIVTMSGGFLGSLVVLSEEELFWGEGYRSSNISSLLVAIVGVLCLFSLIRNIRAWRRIAKSNAQGKDCNCDLDNGNGSAE